MKKSRRRMAALLTVILLALTLTPAALALTEAEKENQYSAALLQVELHLIGGRNTEDMITVAGKLDDLGGYSFSRLLRFYALALSKIEREEFDFELSTYLSIVALDEGFNEYIAQESAALGTAEKLQCYAEGREAEHQGDWPAAMACYQNCLDFFDAASRYTAASNARMSEIYAGALTMLEADDWAGAYFAFQSIPAFADSAAQAAAIVRRIGYTPLDARDNRQTATPAPATPAPVTPLPATPAPDTPLPATPAPVTPVPVTPVPATPVPITPTPVPEVQPGDILTFGHWEQDGQAENGEEAIEWLVLSAAEDKALLLSLHALSARPYHEVRTWITWEECSLRAYLNGAFLAEAFTEDQREAILTTRVDNHDSQGKPGLLTHGGQDTDDQVFLLSYAEAQQYFAEDADRRCVPVQTAIDQGVEAFAAGEDGLVTCGWWLRSPGFYQTAAMFVDKNGAAEYSGFVNAGTAGLRPALWVSLAAAGF